jgi:hypothetical protein
MLTDELHAYLFDGKPHLLAEPVGTWLASSRRFAAFATEFRDKIRKKLRVTQHEETLYDLQLELETAYLLLQERTLSLVYEPQQSREGRGPDFAVTFTTSLTFMVEVTRLRAPASASLEDPLVSPLAGDRFVDAICSKLGQLLRKHSNILIVGTDAPAANLKQSELQAAMLRLQQRAERDESAWWQRYGLRDRADFFRHYQRLSEVLVRETQFQADEAPVIWVNPQAKHSLPGRVRTVLYRTHTLKA